MAEWLKAHAWKACLGETLTWVRIPLSPPRRLDCREILLPLTRNTRNMPAFRDSSSTNRTGENGPVGIDWRECPRFSPEARVAVRFPGCSRRMQCDHKPGIQPRRVDFCEHPRTEFGITPQSRGKKAFIRIDPEKLPTSRLLVYGDLIAHLTSGLGYRLGETLITFGYDWRQQNLITANLLAQTLHAKLAEGFTRIRILSHSMGGIVARLLLADPRNAGIRDCTEALVQIGTPIRGSSKAFHTFAKQTHF